jgi:hypothetical protein
MVVIYVKKQFGGALEPWLIGTLVAAGILFVAGTVGTGAYIYHEKSAPVLAPKIVNDTIRNNERIKRIPISEQVVAYSNELAKEGYRIPTNKGNITDQEFKKQYDDLNKDLSTIIP